jgi:threonine synthase
MMPGLLEGRHESDAAGLTEEDVLPGLCRICGGSVPRASDPTSCTPSLCSEQCLARAIVEYWSALGLQAEVSLRDGFARLEGLRGLKPRP